MIRYFKEYYCFSLGRLFKEYELYKNDLEKGVKEIK